MILSVLTIKDSAHALKGVSGSVAAERVYETAIILEQYAHEGDTEKVIATVQRLCEEYYLFKTTYLNICSTSSR